MSSLTYIKLSKKILFSLKNCVKKNVLHLLCPKRGKKLFNYENKYSNFEFSIKNNLH